MSTELIVASDTITIEEAIKLLVNNRITGFPVVDKANKLVGVLSELDIIRAVQNPDKPSIDLKSPAHFTTKVRSISEDAKWHDILKTFLEKNIRRLPVIDAEGRLKGIITRRDVMKALFYSSKNKVDRG
jgi:CBS domain-containing protein